MKPPIVGPRVGASIAMIPASIVARSRAGPSSNIRNTAENTSGIRNPPKKPWTMRAGTSLQTALDIVITETPAPLAQELGVVVREQRLGVALEDALESMARRLKLEDVDLIVAEFGWRKTGRILLLENPGNIGTTPEFRMHELDSRHGAIHVPAADLNGDGRLDFVALISQEHETVVA